LLDISLLTNRNSENHDPLQSRYLTGSNTILDSNPINLALDTSKYSEGVKKEISITSYSKTDYFIYSSEEETENVKLQVRYIEFVDTN
jgi:hypothetical protein